MPPGRRLLSPPWQSIPPIAKWPPERLAHLVIDDAGIEADVTQDSLVEVRELVARHAAAAPLAQRRDDRAQDHAPACTWRLDRAIGNGGRRLVPRRCPRGRTLRRSSVPKPGRGDRLLALLQECRHDRLLFLRVATTETNIAVISVSYFRFLPNHDGLGDGCTGYTPPYLSTNVRYFLLGCGNASEPAVVDPVAVASPRPDDGRSAGERIRGFGSHHLSRRRSAQRRGRADLCGSRPERRIPVARRLPHQAHGPFARRGRDAVAGRPARTGGATRARRRAHGGPTEIERGVARTRARECRPRRRAGPPRSGWLVPQCR